MQSVSPRLRAGRVAARAVSVEMGTDTIDSILRVALNTGRLYLLFRNHVRLLPHQPADPQHSGHNMPGSPTHCTARHGRVLVSTHRAFKFHVGSPKRMPTLFPFIFWAITVLRKGKKFEMKGSEPKEIHHSIRTVLVILQMHLVPSIH